MKKTGILLIITLLLTSILSYVVFSSNDLVSVINEEGFAVASDAQLLSSLNSGDTNSKTLIAINDTERVYSGITGYYVDKTKAKIDSKIPLYVHNGTSLRFLNDENYLISPDLDMLSSYEGLYLSDGHTYNEEQLQADLDEFILLYIDNGIYMNAQSAIIQTQTEKVHIPANSIIKFTEDKVSLYEYNDSYLSSAKVLITVDSTIEIGNHKYKYDGFIDALGLLNDAVAMEEKGIDSDELISQALGIISKNTISVGNTQSESSKNELNVVDSDNNEIVSEGTGKENEIETDKQGESIITDIKEKEGKDNTSSEASDKEGGSSKRKDESKSSESIPADETEGDGDDDGTVDEEGEGPEIKYVVPTATFGDLKIWSYGINGTLKVNDPADAIIREITITAYRGTKEVAGETLGRSTLARVSLADDGEFTLSTLPPNTKVYIQLSFKYSEPTWTEVTVNVTDEDGNFVFDENGNYKTKKEMQLLGVRKTYRSPIVEVTTVSTDDVKPVKINLRENFAVGYNAFKFDNIKIENTSGYDPTDASFDNFKLNTLPYINRINYNLKADDVSEFTISAGKSIIKKAQTINEYGTYSASSDKAKSNRKYTYDIELIDKYGNIIPCEIGDGYTGIVYTSKIALDYKIKEVENSTKNFIFDFEIIDPDKTIIKKDNTEETEPIKVKIQYKDSNGEYVDELLNGNVTYLDMDPVVEEPLTIDNGNIVLLNPIHGRKYRVKIDSLQYNYTYYLSALASFDINPDGFNELGKFIDKEILPTRKLYTASLDAGLVSFDSSIPTVTDTSVAVNFTMNQETTVNILEVVNRYRFSITSGTNNVILPEVFDLNYDDYFDKIITPGEDGLFEYNNGYVKICDSVDATYDDDGKLLTKAKPVIYLFGNERQLVNKSVWDAITITRTYDEENDTYEYISPATIMFELPANSLSTKTNYNVNVQSLVTKGEREYPVYTKLSATSFKTRKISPKLSDYIFFAASNIAELQNFGVYDIDGTILDYDGDINLKLYYNDLYGINKLVDVKSIKPSNDLSTYSNNTVTFDNLIMNGEYRIDIEASTYNDTDYSTGKKTNVLLKTISFTAGEKLYADLELKKNSKLASGKYDVEFLLNGLDRDQFLIDDSNFYLYLYQSESINQPAYDEENNLLTDEENYVALQKNENNEYVVINKDIKLELDANKSYELIVKCNYNNKLFTLNKYVFNTGDNYVLVSNNDELVSAITANNYANILVVEDFVHNRSVSATFHGTIDFNGHTITRADNNRSYLLNTLASDGVIKNVHYVIPEGYTIPSTNTTTTVYSSLVQTNYGTIEDFVFRFAGETNVYSTNNGSNFNMAFIAYNNNGIIRNFAIPIEGNLNFIRQEECGEAYFSIIARNLSYQGEIKNGAIYSLNGAGVTFRNKSNTFQMYGGLINSYGYYEKTLISNLYIATDVWYTKQTVAFDMDYCYTMFRGHNLSLGSPLYYVGDYYLLNDSDKLSFVNPIYSERMADPSSQRFDQPIWHITQSKSYTNSSNVDVKYATTMQLYDSDWQYSILGDGFVIEEAIQRGYYPRVKLSDCMMKYLDYVNLPILGIDSVPQLVSDSFMYDENHTVGNDNADILFRFKNDRNVKINEIVVDGLNITSITNIGKQNDGLYDVVVHANVAQDSSINYVNEYKVSSFSYANGSRSVSVNPDYKTKNISFYKEIRSVQDWIDINGGYSFFDPFGNSVNVTMSKTLKWNYRIVNDIDFSVPLSNGSVATAKEININGSTKNITSTSSFTGSIDGGVYDRNGNLVSMHTLKNIDLTNVSSTAGSFGLISYCYNARIENIIFDNFNLALSNGSTSSNVGLLGICSSSTTNKLPAVVKNVHVINSSVVGQGNCGVLAGQISTAMVYDCSVQDSKLQDTVNSLSSYFGGMVGYMSSRSALFTNCYVRDIDIDIMNSKKSQAVGGVIGYENYYIANLYATGTINTVSDNVGGISGNGYTAELSAINRGCYSNVSIDTTGSFAYGLGGGVQNTKRKYASSIAFGNIISSGVANRTIPIESKTNNTTSFNGTYAYAGQAVNAMAKDDVGSATELITGSALGLRSTWADKIQIGESYDLSFINDKYMPVLYRLNSNEYVYGQTDNLIDMPGQGGEHLLTVLDTDYNSAISTYSIVCVIEHPKVTHQDFAKLLELGIERLNITIKGMDLEVSSGPNSNIFLGPLREEGDVIDSDLKEKTRLLITCPEEKLNLRLDNYRLVVDYSINRNGGIDISSNPNLKKEYKLQSLFNFGDNNPVWRISNIDEWNDLMSQEIHRNGNETVIITGKIDFKDNEQNPGDTPYRQINLFSLEGDPNVTDAGFYNLSYQSFCNKDINGVNANFNGEPWFENIGNGIRNLKFDNITLNCRGSSIKKSELSLFKYVYGVYNSTFNDIQVLTDYNSGEKTSLISTIKFNPISYVNVNNLKYDFSSSTNLTLSTGAFVNAFYTINNSNFTNININAPKGSAISVCYVDATSYLTDQIMTFENVTITANGSAYLFGNLTYGLMYQLIANNVNITSATSTVAICNAYRTYQNILVKDSTFTSNGGAAYCMSASSGNGSYLSFDNVKVKGKTNAAMIGAYAQTNRYILVNNCDIESTGTGGSYTSGMFGYTTVNGTAIVSDFVMRNTRITGYKNVGAILGYNDKPSTVTRGYIAEDVVVVGKNNNVGGVQGSGTYVLINNVMCGATVESQGSYAGGLVGLVSKDNIQLNILGCTFAGSVSAKEYAGGIIGYVDDPTLRITVDTNNKQINKVLVAPTSVVTNNGTASIWANSANPALLGDAKIYAYNRSIVDGQSIENRVNVDTFLPTTVLAICPSGTIVNYDDIATVANFKTYAVNTTSYFDFATYTPVSNGKLTVYYPFLTLTSTSSYMTNHGYNYLYYQFSSTGEKTNMDKGIKLPLEAPNPEEPYVYASGVSSINIETSNAAKTEVKVNGISYTTDENGVLTFEYNFTSDFTVQVGSGEIKTYHASDVALNSSLYTKYIFFIDKKDETRRSVNIVDVTHDGGVVDGEFSHVNFGDSLASGQSIVHIWKGECLSSDGYSYTFSGSNVIKSSTRINPNNGIAIRQEKPFIKYNAQVTELISYDFSVYYKFTVLDKYLGNVANGSTKANGQVYSLNGNFFTINTYMGVKPNNIAISSSNVQTLPYLIALGFDGQLHSYGSAIKLPNNFDNGNIMSISGNVNNDDGSVFAHPILVVEYEDGYVGINYKTGTQLFSTRPVPSLPSFGLNLLNGIFDTGTNFDNNPNSINDTLASYNSLFGGTPLMTTLSGSNSIKLGAALSKANNSSNLDSYEENEGNGISSNNEIAEELISGSGEIENIETNPNNEDSFFNELPGVFMGYNPYTKEYEAYKTSELATSDNPTSLSDVLSETERLKKMDEENEAKKNSSSSGFKIGSLIINVEGKEKSGSIFTISIIVVSMLVLTIGYLIGTRNRKIQ